MSKLYELDYKPNPRVPVLTSRMRLMLMALDEGGIVQLMEVLYGFAETDYELSDPKRPGGNRKSLRSSMEVMLKDRQDGNRDVLDLLKSMHVDVIRACIDNTVGHRYETSSAFRELLHDADACAGIYGYTLMAEGGTGEFLTGNQIKDLGKRIVRYGKSEGVRNDDEAVEIDGACLGDDFDPRPTRGGARLWLNPLHTPGHQNKTILFGMELQKRAEIDVVGNIPQFQSPMGIGCSGELKRRMNHHLITPQLTLNAHTWGLLISVLKVMKINVVPITVVLLKIWDDRHRAIGEILITMLTSSLVEDGGLNPKQAGMNPGLLKEVDYMVEKQMVFVEKPWMASNSAETKAEMERRLKTIVQLSSSHREEILETQSGIEKDLKDMNALLEIDEGSLESAREALKVRLDQQDADRRELEGSIEAMTCQLNFLAQLDSWQKSL